MNGNSGSTGTGLTPVAIVGPLVAVISLFATQGFIDNRWEKLTTGLASILIPFGWMLYDAIRRHGKANAVAAAINAEAATVQFQAAQALHAPQGSRGALAGSDAGTAEHLLARNKKLIDSI